MIALIAAIQKKDRGLGYKNDLLFKITADLKHFKELTSGHPIIMGRKTFESIGLKPLPNRTNIVVTRNFESPIDGVVFCQSLESSFEVATKIDRNIFVIGGGEIYRQSITFADRLYLTVIEGNVPADTFFPPYDEFNKIIAEENHIDEKSGLKYSFLTLDR